MVESHVLTTGGVETPEGLPAKTRAGTDTILRDEYVEIGPGFEDQTVETTVPIDRTAAPHEVTFKVHLVSTAARRMRSPAYLATIRRRRAEKIAKLITDLRTHSDDDDFVIWTHAPLDEIRRLIRTLSDAEEYSNPEHEANSCEILRQLRDTFLNTGWEQYRRREVRDLAFSILKGLASADDVTADRASEAMDRLLDLNLDPAVGILWGNSEEVPG